MLELVLNTGMDLYERRRNQLLKLIDERTGGKRALFCKTYGIDESRLGQLLSTTLRDGRTFGERAARSLEKRLKLPDLYFDSADYAASAPTPGLKVEENRYTRPYNLIYCNAEEMAVLTAMREANEVGYDMIIKAAKNAPRDLSKLKTVKSAG